MSQGKQNQAGFAWYAHQSPGVHSLHMGVCVCWNSAQVTPCNDSLLSVCML